IAVLREGRVIPRRLVGAQTDEPAEQEVELEPLHQLALGPDRVERLQQHRPQQHLRRDRGPARAPVKRRELAAQSVERLVDDAPDRPQRMIPPDAPLHVHIGKQLPAPPIRPAHPTPPRRPRQTSESHVGRASEGFFNGLLDVARGIDDAWSRAEAVAAVAQRLPAEAALDVARGIDDAERRAWALAAVAERLPAEEALDV